MKTFYVSWWIHGAGRIIRGFDVVKAEELDEDSMEELIHEDLARKLRDPKSTTADKYDFPSDFARNLPKFCAVHEELMIQGRHSEISNWGIIKIKEVIERKSPYSFEPGAIYVCQVLEHGRWVTKSRGKPTLRRMRNFLKIMESPNSGFRVRKRLPNGIWFGACHSSDHYGFVKAVVGYLEYCKVSNIIPKASEHSMRREQ